MQSSDQLVLGDGRGNKTHGHSPLWEKPSHMWIIVRDLAEIIIHSPHSVLMGGRFEGGCTILSSILSVSDLHRETVHANRGSEKSGSASQAHAWAPNQDPVAHGFSW